MPQAKIANSVLLPELKLKRVERIGPWRRNLHCEKRSAFEVCPKCAQPSHSVYDRRKIRVKDAPLRNLKVWLVIEKRRFWCKPCQKPFTEPVPGILPKRRTTQRFRTLVYWACENFVDLKRVHRNFEVSHHFIYSALYEKLELNRRMRQYPWPKTIGIDEHAFKRKRAFGNQKREFVSMIVDHTHKRLMEVVHGRSIEEMKASLSHIPGRKNVTHISLDLSDPYKTFAQDFFPNASLVADKFHVLRLLHPAINKARKEITGDRRTLRIRTLLLQNSKRLDYFTRRAIFQWLDQYPALKELYETKEALHRFYRTRGYHRASKILTRLTDHMASTHLKEIKTLRKTLLKWREEILNYFKTGITNARTEGFNNVAKVIKRRGYGFRSFRNYRLRLLNACC